MLYVVQTNVLNEVIMDAVAMNPTPTDKGKRLKIYYTTQVAVNHRPLLCLSMNRN